MPIAVLDAGGAGAAGTGSLARRVYGIRERRQKIASSVGRRGSFRFAMACMTILAAIIVFT